MPSLLTTVFHGVAVAKLEGFTHASIVKPVDKSSPGSILYFKVDDIDAIHTDLEGKGVDFLGAPHMIAKLPDHELWMAFFRDGEGNTLALMHEKR